MGLHRGLDKEEEEQAGDGEGGLSIASRAELAGVWGFW